MRSSGLALSGLKRKGRTVNSPASRLGPIGGASNDKLTLAGALHLCQTIGRIVHPQISALVLASCGTVQQASAAVFLMTLGMAPRRGTTHNEVSSNRPCE
jgi:hypothetical protein